MDPSLPSCVQTKHNLDILSPAYCQARCRRCRHPPFGTIGAWKHRCDVIRQVLKAVCTPCRAASVEAFVHQSCGGYKLQSESSPRVTWSSAGYQSRCPFGDINVFQVCPASHWTTISELKDSNRTSLPCLFKAKTSATWHHHVRSSQYTPLFGGYRVAAGPRFASGVRQE